MKAKCGLCEKTERGRCWKLQKKGWLIVFIRGHKNLIRCWLHKPLLWKKRKVFKEYKSDLLNSIKEELKEKFNEINMLKKL